MIMSGDKTQTRRLNKPSVKVGKEYRLRRGYYSYLADRIRIIQMFTQNLGEITVEEVLKEGFSSLEDFKTAWEGIYGDWDPEKRVWVVEFQHIREGETFKEKT